MPTNQNISKIGQTRNISKFIGDWLLFMAGVAQRENGWLITKWTIQRTNKLTVVASIIV